MKDKKRQRCCYHSPTKLPVTKERCQPNAVEEKKAISGKTDEIETRCLASVLIFNISNLNFILFKLIQLNNFNLFRQIILNLI